MTLVDPRVGDVVLLDSDGSRWRLVEKRNQVDFWAYNNNTDTYTTIRPAQYPLYTKREPRFEVGHVYRNTLDNPPINYTVAVVDGQNVLLWWTDAATGNRLASWIPYEDRKNFEEVI